ncbi:Glutathione S-transferase D7 [Chionoecetes opilio]|uniref:Glutathione S-transferase D7 n=1 Tax=Chionoecetes opilio TaxID=41210 RepID=A0A8J5CZH6_CHIOP|nr:Glutathione S-transferase D7 [Chionoecetes opilio]
MAPTLYSFLLSPYSRSVLVTAEALDLQLDVRTIDLMQGDQKKPEFVAINPQHTVPTLVDGDLVLTESRAIVTYLASRYSRDDALYPKDVVTRAKVDALLYFDCATLCTRSHAVVHPVMKAGASKPSEESLKNLAEALTWLDDKLQQHPGRYLAGTVQPTVADVCLATWACTYEAAGFSLGQHPRLAAWVARCRDAIKGFKEVNEVGAAQFGEMYKALLKSRS